MREAEGLIKTLDSLGAEDPRWTSALQQIKSSLEGHIRKEEDEIFPRVDAVWDRARLERAGEEMQAMKTGAGATGQSPQPVASERVTAANSRGERQERPGGMSAAGERLTEMVEDGLNYARRQPGTALLAAAGAGMLLGLLMKSARR